MPVQRVEISRSQLGELLGIEPSRLLGFERTSTGFRMVLEDDMQVTQAFPQNAQGTKKKGGKGKRGC